MKELSQKARSIIKTNGFLPFILFFLVGLLVAGIMLLRYFLDFLPIVLFPLVIVPLIFGAIYSTYALRDENVLTAGLFFKGFGRFFTDPYNSTFRIIRSALISLLISIVFSIVYSLTINLILYSHNFMGYQAIVADFMEHLNVNPEDLVALYNKYAYFFNVMDLINAVPITFVFAMSFLFFTSINAVSVNYRIENEDKVTGRVASLVHKTMIKNYKKKFYKGFFYLNWPVFLIYIIGFGLGVVLGYFTTNGTFSAVISLADSVPLLLIIGIYGPIWLANNEALYLSLKDEYNSTMTALSQGFTNQVEELIKQMQKEDPEETKKDSDES